MLLDFDAIYSKYKMDVKGVVQVGSHRAQENDLYLRYGIINRVYIEPNKTNFQILLDRFANDENVILVNVACGDEVGDKVAYVETVNQGQSSSLLAPKIHLVQHKEIVFDDAEVWPVTTLDNIPFERSNYNLLNVDVQGYEAFVLRGAKETLKYIDYIFLEVNREELYEGCPMVEELDEMLPEFKRVETGWASPNHGWGDGYWIRKTLLNE